MITRDNLIPILKRISIAQVSKFNSAYVDGNVNYISLELKYFNVGTVIALDTYKDYNEREAAFCAENGDLYLSVDEFINLIDENPEDFEGYPISKIFY